MQVLNSNITEYRNDTVMENSDSKPDTGKGKAVEKVEDAGGAAGILSAVANSASTLAGSLLQGPATSLNKDLSSVASSSSKQQPSASASCPSGSTWAEQAPGPSSIAGIPNFRTAHPPPSTISGALPIEDEFQAFASGSSERAGGLVGENAFAHTTTYTKPTYTYSSSAPPIDGGDVLALLDQPGSIESIWEAEEEAELIRRNQEDGPEQRPLPNLNHPLIQKFIECEDIAEFLEMAPSEDWGYSEEVWGDYVGLVREAKKEVEEKSTTNREAVERLRMVWGHLRSSKL